MAAEPEQYAALNKLAAQIGNVTPLHVGQIVSTRHNFGNLRRARVEEMADEEGWVVCLSPSASYNPRTHGLKRKTAHANAHSFIFVFIFFILLFKFIFIALYLGFIR